MVERGLYSTRFRHAEADRAFVAATLSPLLEGMPAGRSVLEVGCGVGEWLALVGSLQRDRDRPAAERYGFDLSPAMIEIALEYLAGDVPADHLAVADLLEPEAYRFPDAPPVGLVYAYDVVQQLPPRMQRDGVRAMYRGLDRGGVLVVFDQDARHPAGRRMALKKLVTRWLRLPLVPRFYLLARYPDPAAIVAALEHEGALVDVRRGEAGARIAIVARRPG
jgi:SAM-dependent methyltransferase